MSLTVGDGSGSSLVDFWWCNMLDWPKKSKCFTISLVTGNIFHIQNNEFGTPPPPDGWTHLTSFRRPPGCSQVRGVSTYTGAILYHVFAKYEKSMWGRGSSAILATKRFAGVTLEVNLRDLSSAGNKAQARDLSCFWNSGQILPTRISSALQKMTDVPIFPSNVWLSFE